MWVKICANTNLPDALAALEAGADALGFVFTESSRRVTAAQVKPIIAGLPAGTECIGVFADETAPKVMEAVRECGLTGIQLHGDETASYIKDIVRMAEGLPLKIIKTFSANAAYEISSASSAVMEENVDAFLVDSGNAAGRGGTGQVFDWLRAGDFVIRLKQRSRVIIAGGLNAANVASAIRLFQPYGVDVASGVEKTPGQKDVNKLKAFISAARSVKASGSAAH